MRTIAHNKVMIYASFVLLTLVLGFRIFYLVYDGASVLYVLDRWHTQDPLFYHYSWWEGFAFQHGPHRLGVLYFLFKADAYLSDWNNRADMYVQALAYLLSALLALKLKVKLFGPIQWSDLLIPLIFLTPHAASTLLDNPFVHGLIPLFGLAFCFGYLISSRLRRVLWLSALCFLAAFSGFAFVYIPIVAALELIRFFRQPKKQLYALIPAAVGVFSLAYVLLTNLPKESWEAQPFSLPDAIRYSLALAGNLFILQPKDSALIGVTCLFVGIVGMWIYFIAKGKGALLLNRVNLSIFLLLGGTLVFWVLNIYGRAHLSVGNAHVSRYIPLGMTFALSLYFCILKFNTPHLKTALLLLFFALLIRVQTHTHARLAPLLERASYYEETTECLLAERNFEQCKGTDGHHLHPDPQRIRLQEKLNFLRDRKLNIYAP
jgi:hypothetical protein